MTLLIIKGLSNKLEHYVVRGVANRRFETYLCNRKKYVSVNGFKSNPYTLTCRVSQGSVEFHFVDDTNLFHINKSLKMLHKFINWQTGLLRTKLHEIFQN